MFLPITAKEVSDRGWDSVDFVYVTGDAYVDHPSFGVAIITRVMEAEGYRVDMIEFVDLDASPKNLMLRAEYTGKPKRAELDKALALQREFGIITASDEKRHHK